MLQGHQLISAGLIIRAEDRSKTEQHPSAACQQNLGIYRQPGLRWTIDLCSHLCSHLCHRNFPLVLRFPDPFDPRGGHVSPVTRDHLSRAELNI